MYVQNKNICNRSSILSKTGFTKYKGNYTQ